MNSKTTKAVMQEWLASLGTLVAGQMPVQEAKQRIQAYASLLDYPSFCYTADTLKSAARRFKWFPAFAELAEFFDGIKADVLREKYRCEQIVKAKAHKVDDHPLIPAEERAKVTDGFAKLIANFGRGGDAA